MKRFSLISTVLLASSLLIVANPAPEPAPSITPVTAGFNLDWNGTNGNTYFIEYSSDLTTWQYMPAIEFGAGAPLGYGFNSPDNRLFLRLKFTDTATGNPLTDDFDADGISNWDEVRIGGSSTDPFNGDTDGDGVLDGNEDSNGNGLSDKFEFNLLGNWNFDEAVGNSVISDSSSNLLDGELLTATRIADGIHGSAVSLNATQQMKITPAVGQLNVGDSGSDFSVSFWIRLHANHEPGWNTILQKGNTSNQRTFGIYLKPDGQKIHARISSTSSVNEGIDTSNASLKPMEWTHISYVHGGGRLKLYINGHLDSSAAVSATIGNDDPFYIGKSNWLRGVNADFDEIMIHRSALSAIEVNELVGVDRDNDGLPDIWEKLWAQSILDTVDLSTLSAEQIAQLLQGDINPSIDYNGDGFTAGQNFQQDISIFGPLQYTYQHRRESWWLSVGLLWEKEEDGFYQKWTSGYDAFFYKSSGYEGEIQEYAYFLNGGYDDAGEYLGNQNIGEYRLKLSGLGSRNYSKTFIIIRRSDRWAEPPPPTGVDPNPPVMKSLGTVTYSVSDAVNDGKVTIELNINNDSDQTITVKDDEGNGIQYLRIEPNRLAPVAESVLNSYTLLPVEVTAAFGVGPDIPEGGGDQTSRELLKTYLDGINVARTGDIWAVNGKDQQGNDKIWVVEIVNDQAKLNAALASRGRYVIFDGHSNYGLGPEFGEVTITKIGDLTNYGVKYTDVPLNFRLRGDANDPLKWGTPFILMQVADNEIPAAPLNYASLPINTARFPNLSGVAVGQAFQRQGAGFGTWHYISNVGTRLIIDAPATDLPAQLAYKTFFYNACSTGIDYIENFNHGEFVYTTDSCRVHMATQLFVEGVIEGDSTADILENRLNVDEVGAETPTNDIYEMHTF